MEKSLFTSDNIIKTLEQLFINDRFVQWTGERTPDLFRFLNNIDISFDTIPGTKSIKICTDNGYYIVPAGSWIVKAPDGKIYAFGEGVRFITNIPDDITKDLQKKIGEIEIPITFGEKLITTYYPEDIFESEVVETGSGIAMRRKLDKDGKPILKKRYHCGGDTSNAKDYSSLNIFAKNPRRNESKNDKF